MIKETDLYPIVCRYLEQQGFEVKAEVKHCDVVAVRGVEPPVIVELKTTLNLELVLQAADRLKKIELLLVTQGKTGAKYIIIELFPVALKVLNEQTI